MKLTIDEAIKILTDSARSDREQVDRLNLEGRNAMYDASAEDKEQIAKWLGELKGYQNTENPSVGDVWEGYDEVIVITELSGGWVRVINQSRKERFITEKDLKRVYQKTGKTCKSLFPFLNELESLHTFRF